MDVDKTVVSNQETTEDYYTKDSESSQQQHDVSSNEEKLRLIDQTDGFNSSNEESVQMHTSTGEYIWQAIFLSVPFGFLLATFDISVRVQYHQFWDYNGAFTKCLYSAPTLAPLIYLTNRYRSNRNMQVLMTLGSIITGSSLMYVLHRSSSLEQMTHAPGLATVWIYFVIQLDLLPATMTLIFIGLYWFFKLRN